MTTAKAPTEPERMTTAEAAEYLGISVKTLEGTRGKHRSRYRPGPPFHRELGRSVFYLRSELDAYRGVSEAVVAEPAERKTRRQPLPAKPREERPPVPEKPREERQPLPAKPGRDVD